MWNAAQLQQPIIDRGSELLRHKQGFFVLDKTLQLSDGPELIGFAGNVFSKHADIIFDKWFLRLSVKLVDKMVRRVPVALLLRILLGTASVLPSHDASHMHAHLLLDWHFIAWGNPRLAAWWVQIDVPAKSASVIVRRMHSSAFYLNL